jgi:uncharacterized protein
VRPMNLLMTGATGLVGTRLSSLLTHHGHRIVRLRHAHANGKPGQSPAGGAAGAAPTFAQQQMTDIVWEPGRGELRRSLATVFAGKPPVFDAVIHLAGASIGECRWTEGRKQLLYSSRVDTTRQLIAALAQLPVPPRHLLSASAIGYYGDQGDAVLTEESAPGANFLAKLARDWETAATGAEDWGARVVLMRFGVVLAREGGALPEMMRPFRLGVGGKLGAGRQWMSWIALEDVACAVHFLLEHVAVRGPVNLVSPEPVRNAVFTRELAKAMRRPALFRVPRAALRLLLGQEMADALLFASQRVVPSKLHESGYQFLHPHLDAALHSVLHGSAT